ncbi:hypothetical protein [Streptococcus mutans]|uniref:hypothetical protein n=1 Tax=Streptococcus mutans TaxID=1309 RepID=UPI0002D97F07|nr:hypothetical protein [Streptococcus mutans]
MKRKFIILISLFVSLLIVTACDLQNVNQSIKKAQQAVNKRDDKMTVSNFFKKVKRANRSVETVHFDMTTDVESRTRKHQTMTADIGYDSYTASINRANIIIEETINGVDSYQELVGNQNSSQSRTSKDGNWTKSNAAGSYRVHPSYFNFLKVLYTMKDDLVLKQSGNVYRLGLRSQNVDIVSLFKEELNLYLRGVSQSELKKGFEVTFDKKTFHLKTFKLSLSYAGSRGQLDMIAKGEFSRWNKLSDSQFSVSDSDA